jgi:hypothetical protein
MAGQRVARGVQFRSLCFHAASSREARCPCPPSPIPPRTGPSCDGPPVPLFRTSRASRPLPGARCLERTACGHSRGCSASREARALMPCAAPLAQS